MEISAAEKSRNAAHPTSSSTPLAPSEQRTFDVPTQRTGPERELPAPAGTLTRRRRTMMIVAVTTTLALGGGGTAVAYLQRTKAAEAVRQAHAVEVAAQAQVFAAEQVMLRKQNSAAFWQATLADRAVAVGAAGVALEGARAALAAAPQAGDAARNTLQAAITLATAVVAETPTASVLSLEAAVGSLAGPLESAAAAQVAWQVAEDARLAAERVAAEAAAAAQAAAAQAAAARATPRATSSRAATPRSSAAPAPAAGGAAAPAPASSVPEFSAGALGGAINDWRAGQGLPALSVSRSSGLVAHASAMAQAGSIWHGGSDKIVGYVQPASAGSLVQAWANSAGHRAWMVRTDVSSMQVGAASLNNTLYGAVNFS